MNEGTIMKNIKKIYMRELVTVLSLAELLRELWKREEFLFYGILPKGTIQKSMAI